MKAMMFSRYGGPGVLEAVELEPPVAGAGQLLLRVLACSVNPVDWKLASGKLRFIMPVKLPCVAGHDVCGEVLALGPGVSGFVMGQRVYARLNRASGGASAEVVVADVSVTAPVPAGMDAGEAAGLPLAGMTALQALHSYAGLPRSGASARVLVVGASGGVGHLAVQLAAAAGATVVGVCSARNAALVKSLGAHVVIDYAAPDPYRGQAPFDVIVDCVGGPPSPWLPRLTGSGHLVSCMPGPAIMLRSALNPLTGRKVHAVRLNANATDLRALGDLVSAGKLKVVVDSHFPLGGLAAAWARSQTGRVVGKVIVDVNAAGTTPHE